MKEWLRIIEGYVSDIEGWRRRGNCECKVLGMSMGEREEGFIWEGSWVREMMGWGIGKELEGERLERVGFCDMLLNEKSIEEWIVCEFVLFGMGELGCGWCFWVVKFIVGKGVVDVLREVFDRF